MEPFGGDVLVSRDVLWTTQPVAGWRVPWGRYEVLGAPPGSPPDWTFKPTDFFGYLAAYAAGSPEADLTGTAVPGVLGYGAPDGRISTDDFFYFLSLYSL